MDDLLLNLSGRAAEVDQSGSWPTAQWQDLRAWGVLGWVIPREFGGTEVSAEWLIRGYERLAGACLTTAFILTQRNGACQRLTGADTPLVRQWLPQLAAGRLFATVGISHLTTSRQHLGRPVVEVKVVGDQYVLNGQVPWVTGGTAADIVVTGGTCADGREVLLAVPTDRPGVTLLPPARLLALNGSQTGAVELRDVCVDAGCLLAGPMAGVMRSGGGGAGSLTTSALAVGLSGRTIGLLLAEATARADLARVASEFSVELARLQSDLYATARGDEATGVTAELLRQRANSLALRCTQALMAASKGAGFVSGHPAERAVREAMFFLVWSCPQPVVQAALHQLACLSE